MRITAKTEYAALAAVYLANTPAATTKAADIAHAEELSAKFLEAVLSDLRRAGLVVARRGPEGGYALARPAASITLADLIRAVEGPLAEVRDTSPEDVRYREETVALRDVWVAVRASLRRVLEHVTVADVASGTLPRPIRRLLDDPGAWERR